MDYYVHIKNFWLKELTENVNKKYILFPFGERGHLVKSILNDCFGRQEEYIIDNQLSLFNNKIYNVEILKKLRFDEEEYRVVLTSDNWGIIDELKSALEQYVPSRYILEVFEKPQESGSVASSATYPVVGKYSYGPLCKCLMVESIGAFCSFAVGTDALINHSMDYVSTHPFLYYGGVNDNLKKTRDEKAPAYFPDIEPKGKRHKSKKSVIGNDVWLGRNVLITNGANIGNGVIAGAGAVITKDVPDYAIVAGVPAKVVRYRYTEEQIEKLNKIAWWDWDDDKIRKNLDDMYLDIDEFIAKHYIEE